ncbi:ornithine carbamoyltransferase [Candidatus Woesearchaeota archaeon]|jgi:ornithine carbamoyltransferase|nr:ornithine carbamoyltransferase [Candidatus Woesearchaeota archaeon]MBT5215370.1 ornithine carbamoyltransferase [Candidatus Woesearchaeota archaeon]MBT6402083.1 ornithine carbamoyltransferase [Candidatus Woesearchaeota archaeon]
MKNLVSLSNISPKDFQGLIDKAIEIKSRKSMYTRSLFEKSLIMIFQAPSLRTRVSFEVAMTQLHGSAINYYSENSPWGLGKESMEDVARTLSQYCDVISARIYSHSELKKLAKNASVPVINMMTNDGHPCQILGDFLTIQEKLGKTKGLKIAYLGDAENNVTYSLMRACALTGNSLTIACPKNKEYSPKERVVTETKKLAKKYKNKAAVITTDPLKAAKNADVIYTDSWMSYRIPQEEKNRRLKDLKPFQVNKKVFSQAKKTAVFMHCLPAMRGHEVTEEIIDGKKSIVFPQAQNRLHIQKAILMKLLNK